MQFQQSERATKKKRAFWWKTGGLHIQSPVHNSAQNLKCIRLSDYVPINECSLANFYRNFCKAKKNPELSEGRAWLDVRSRRVGLRLDPKA